MRALAQELVGLQPAIILPNGNPTTVAVQRSPFAKTSRSDLENDPHDKTRTAIYSTSRGWGDYLCFACENANGARSARGVRHSSCSCFRRSRHSRRRHFPTSTSSPPRRCPVLAARRGASRPPSRRARPVPEPLVRRPRPGHQQLRGRRRPLQQRRPQMQV
jgi:hypothetical protein